MNYKKFYKMAEDANADAETELPAPPAAYVSAEAPPAESADGGKSDGKTWRSNIGGTGGYQSQLPMLALLAGAGALGGYAFSNKKKRGAGALYGGLSLPAIYLAYLASKRNIFPEAKADFLDRGAEKVNAWGNQYLPDYFQREA